MTVKINKYYDIQRAIRGVKESSKRIYQTGADGHNFSECSEWSIGADDKDVAERGTEAEQIYRRETGSLFPDLYTRIISRLSGRISITRLFYQGGCIVLGIIGLFLFFSEPDSDSAHWFRDFFIGKILAIIAIAGFITCKNKGYGK